MTDQDLIAAFLASKKPTVVPSGVRATTDAQMKRAIGYQPDKEYKWEVFAMGEDGANFTVHVSATNKRIAEEKFKEAYPESFIHTIDHVGARADRAYRLAASDYEGEE